MAKPQMDPCPKCGGEMRLTGERQDVNAPPSPASDASDELATVQVWTCVACGETVERVVDSAPLDDTDITDTELRKRGTP